MSSLVCRLLAAHQHNLWLCVTAGVCEGRAEANVWLLNSDISRRQNSLILTELVSCVIREC